jgi:hypothetical protein
LAFTQRKPTGCASAIDEPSITMQSACWRSCWKVVAAPLPHEVPRPGTVELCHMRAWFSIWTAPIAVTSFLIRYHHGHSVDRTLAFAHLGGATLDNEEN